MRNSNSESSQLRHSSSQSMMSKSQALGDIVGESKVSVACAGFRTVSAEEFGCAEDAGMGGQNFGLISSLDGREVGDCERRCDLCYDVTSSAELSSLTSFPGSRYLRTISP